MSRRPKRTQPQNSLVVLLLQLVPFAAACGLCALLYFGFRVQPPPDFPERPHDDTHCVLVPAKPTRKEYGWAQNLRDWAWLRDPTLMVLPNESRGFSKVRKHELDVPPAPVPQYEFEVAAVPEEPTLPVQIAGPEEPLPHKVASAWTPAQPPPVEPRIIEPFARGIFWRFHDGRLLQNAPDVSPAAVRDAIKEAGFPKYPTALRVSRPEASETARVRVYRSCGNPQLDRLAVQTVRKAVGNLELQEYTPNSAMSPPNFLPEAGGSTEFEIEWSVPVEPTM